MTSPLQGSCATRLRRLLRYRLVVPMKRSARRPEYTARAVSVALFWAFTPLIPVQTYFLGATWLIARRIPGFDFNLIVALAWIWVTNVVTAPPVYFVFYLTGQFLLGRGPLVIDFGTFTAQWQTVIAQTDGVIETLQGLFLLTSEEQGLPLFVGCVPYALASSWLGYVLALRFMRRQRLQASGQTPKSVYRRP
jgi:uncharacterized protein